MEINSDLVKKNDEILQSYGSKCINRRIKKELEPLYNMYDDITISINSNKLKVGICKINDKKKQQYDFEICENYPFRPPKIFYQNRPYSDFLKINYSKNELSLVKKITGNECLCCSSLNCRDNWTPAITLQKIILDINRVKILKRNIINKLLADKIKYKYLIDDIDLDSWLF